MTFTFDRADLPTIEKETEWPHRDGETVELYRAGDWSFELPDDRNPAEAKKAALAWIAWYEHLTANEE